MLRLPVPRQVDLHRVAAPSTFLYLNHLTIASGSTINSQMILDGSKMGFTRGWYRLTSATQKIANERAGAQVHYDTKAEKIGWEWIVNQAPTPPVKGKHDTIYVYLLALLPNTDRVGRMTPAAQLTEIMARTREMGTVIVETATGYRSDDRGQRKKMISWAHESIRTGNRGRLPVGLAKPGRRAAEFDADIVEAGRLVWFSKKYGTDGIAVEHLPEGMTRAVARRLYGPSGRAPSRKPQQKRR